MLTNQSNRLIYLDNIKALGICLVILYHCQYVPFNSMFLHGIYAMCVPLFFVVNGFLMLRKEYSISCILKKNIKLLLVMFFWALISSVVYIYVTESDFVAKLSIGERVRNIVCCSLTISKPECNHLRFLKAIFVLNLLNPIFYHFVSGDKTRLIYLLALMTAWSVAFFDIISCRLANPLVHWLTAFSVLYYLLGHAVLDKKLNIIQTISNKKYSKWILISIIVICAILQWGYNWIFIEGILHTLNAKKGWIIDIVYDNYNALFIVIMTIAVSVLFQKITWKENKFWSFVGKNSLAIYLLQTPVQRLLKHYLPLQELINIHHELGFILPILTLLVSMLITYILLTNKYTRYLITI